MQGWITDYWWRFYLVLSGCIAVGYAATFPRRKSPWPLGDWLINYEGGFVRRGFPGVLLFKLSHLLHIPLVWSVSGIQSLCVIVTIACLWPLVRSAANRGSTFWEKALLLSPATLAFFWLDPQLILRKELAFFALLGVLTAILLRRPEVSDVILIAFLSLSCPLLLLAHEALVCFFPYLGAVVLLSRPGLRRNIKIWALPALLSALALIAAVTHPGNETTATQVCNSVGGASSGLCVGPIDYLAIPRSVYRGEVLSLMRDRRMMILFAITLPLALLPALIEMRQLSVSRRTNRFRNVPLLAFCLSGAASIALFLQAQDWSRWIYIHAMSLMFILLFYARELEGPSTHSSTQSTFSRKWPIFALLLYGMIWRLPESTSTGVRDYHPYGYWRLLDRLDRHLR